MRAMMIVAVVLLAGGEAAAQSVEGPRTFSGRGSRTIGPIEMVEGVVQLRLVHQTSRPKGRFSVHLFGDTNRDGNYARNEPTDNLLYSGAGSIDERVRRPLPWTGAAKLRVRATGEWRVTIWSKRAPLHAIRGVVRDPKGRPVPRARVTIHEAGARPRTVQANAVGLYTAPVRGGRSYRVNARARGMEGSKRVFAAGHVPARATADVRVRPSTNADLSVSLLAGERHLIRGESTRVTVRIHNAGPADARVVIKGKLANAGGVAAMSGLQIDRAPLFVPFGGTRAVRVRLVADRIGAAKITLSVSSERPDPVAANNRATIDFRVTNGLVRGRVLTIDHLGDVQPIVRAQVALRLDRDKARYETTDAAGRYVVHGLDHGRHRGQAYRVQVALRGRCPGGRRCVDVYHRSRLISAASRGVFRTPRQGHDVHFTGTTNRVGAVQFVNAQRAFQVAHERLGARLDGAPLAIRLASGGQRSHYIQDNVHLSNRMSTLATFVPDVLFHEVGHHVHSDIVMGGDNRLPALNKGDVNHGGSKNSDSTDSVTEGFATFFACVVKGESIFRQSGTRFALNLERNSWYGTGWEELFVAGMLWDLADSNNEPGDRLALGPRRLLQVMSSPTVTTVRSLYRALAKAGVGKRDVDGNKRPELDDVFVLHKFFSERSQPYQRFNGRDEPGWADYYSARRRHGLAPRHSPPTVSGGTLRYTLSGGGAQAYLVVRVEYPTGQEAGNYSYIVRPDGRGQIELYVPRDSLRLTITPVAVGRRGAPLVLTPQRFWASVTRARRAKNPVFATHRFQMQTYPVSSPTNARVERVDAHKRIIVWRTPPDVDEVVVVRRADRLPRSPADGVLVYRGLANRARDEIAADVPQFYALFAIKSTAPSTPAVVHDVRRVGLAGGDGTSTKSTAARPVSPRAEASGDDDAAEVTMPMKQRARRGCCDSAADGAGAQAVLLTVLLLLGSAWRRRRRRGQRRSTAQ